MTQLPLDRTLEPAPAEPKLGPRQQLVLDQLRQRGQLDADEAGAIIHAHRGRHDQEARCQWCGKEGNWVLRKLRAHGLAIHRRGGPWEPLGDLPPRPVTPGDPTKTQSDEIPF